MRWLRPEGDAVPSVGVEKQSNDHTCPRRVPAEPRAPCFHQAGTAALSLTARRHIWSSVFLADTIRLLYLSATGRVINIGLERINTTSPVKTFPFCLSQNIRGGQDSLFYSESVLFRGRPECEDTSRETGGSISPAQTATFDVFSC